MKKLLAILMLVFPLLVSAQLANYKASFSFGGGATQYFGDLSHRFVNLKLSSYSANAALQFKPTKGIGIELEYKYVSLLGDDRASYFILDNAKPNPNFNRSLNFKSSIHETNLKFYFYLNNGKIMSKYAVVSPYFFVGIGAGLFNSKSDLLSANGSYYYYWNDGTIRDLAESDPLSAAAEIITKDKNYETDLSSLQTETKYSKFKWQVPFGFGLNFKLSKSIYLSLQTEWVYNSTDYIDDVGNKSELSSYPNSFSEYAADPANVITGTRGNNNNWKDSYLNTTMKFNFYFGNKDRNNAKNISSQIIIPVKDFNLINKIDTIKANINTPAIVKDTVVLIYKIIDERTNNKDTVFIYNAIKNIKADTIFQRDTVLKTKIIDSISIQNNIKDTLSKSIFKTPIIIDSLSLSSQKDTVKIVEKIKIITDTIYNKIDTIKKTENLKSSSQIKTNTVSSVLKKTKLDSIITANDLKIKKNINDAKIIAAANDKITEKVAVTNDTIYKYAQIDNSTNQQLIELNNYKIENENLRQILERQKVYNDSLKTIYLNTNLYTQNTNENLPSPALVVNPNIDKENQAAATNSLAEDSQKNIQQDFQQNNPSKTQISNPQPSQEVLALQKELERLKLQNQNKTNTVEQPVINQSNKEIESLKLEIQKLKENNKQSDKTGILPTIDYKTDQSILLKNKIEQLENQKNNVDTIVITKNNINAEELTSLKSDLDAYKKELEQIKIKQKLTSGYKVDTVPMDSLLIQVFFEINQINLNEKYESELYKIYQTLLLKPEYKLMVTGFADHDGDNIQNLRLSGERAQSVKNYFVVNKKINYNRILMNYVGSNQTKISDNKDYNRRVDVYLFK